MSDRVTLDSPSLAGSVKSTPAKRSMSQAPNRQPRSRLSDYERRPQRRQQPTVAAVEATVAPAVSQASPRQPTSRPPVNANRPQPHGRYDNPVPIEFKQAGLKARSLNFNNPFSGMFEGRLEFLKDKALYIVAALLFLIGMYVSVNGYLVTSDARSQVKSLIDRTSNYYVDEPQTAEGGEEAIPDEAEPSEEMVSNYFVAPDRARYLSIPSLDVKARVTMVAKDKVTNAVGVPGSVHDVGLFDQGAQPFSTRGAMFAVGHNRGWTADGVFVNLHKLEIGDLVEMEKGDGEVLTFKVVTIDTYDLGSVNMVAATRPVNNEKLGLNLMTCGGAFDAETELYQERILVRTELVQRS